MSVPDPERPEPTLFLGEFLPYRLSILASRVSQTLAAAYNQRFGMTIPEWRVMAVLGQFPGLSAAEVAEKTAMDKVRVSRAVAALSAAGRVLRAPDPRDGRRASLRLSAAGRRVYAEVVPLARSYERRLLEALGADERRELDGIIERLLDRASLLNERDWSRERA